MAQILIVEDNVMFRRVHGRGLEAAGHESAIAGDGALRFGVIGPGPPGFGALGSNARGRWLAWSGGLGMEPSPHRPIYL